VGFAQTLVLKSPLCNVNGPSAAGPGCNAAAGLNDIGGSGFRVGVDGTIPVPTVPTISSPIVPANPFGEVLSFSLDPSFKVGRSYSYDFTIQRELPGNMLMELGYIGRMGRDLPNSVDFDSSPYMLKDPASGQTFAQAFDAVAAQVAANTPLNQITPQPWFEDQLPGFNANVAAGCGGSFANTTQCLVSQNQSQFSGRFVSSLFQNMGFDRSALGLLPYNNLQVVLALFVRTHNDISNYNAATFTLHKRPTHGLQFDLNYTFPNHSTSLAVCRTTPALTPPASIPICNMGRRSSIERMYSTPSSTMTCPRAKGTNSASTIPSSIKLSAGGTFRASSAQTADYPCRW